MVVPDRPAYVPKYPEQNPEHEDEAELGFVDSSVALGHPDDPPVV